MFSSNEEFLKVFSLHAEQYQLSLLRKWDNDYETGDFSPEVKAHIKQKILWAIAYLQ